MPRAASRNLGAEGSSTATAAIPRSRGTWQIRAQDWVKPEQTISWAAVTSSPYLPIESCGPEKAASTSGRAVAGSRV
ncbi:hypothetical protein H4W80_000613 [Nonomuraea angiospora]|uniref:Uncharacterized protein n=1 Tax=Nonomuraea angiospora TaxID=46172 RepID=A0ABR9LPX8_9ACTN|nr:hypothetical protein [Nonomuraea angiospora]